MQDSMKLHLRYNLVYGGIIALGIVVLLLTVQWGAIEDLVQYITFGLTLTSLFLALIAIFYAIVSNSSLSVHLGSLRHVAESVSAATGTLRDVSTHLGQQIDEIPALLRGIEAKVDQTREDIAEANQNLPALDAARQGELTAPDGAAVDAMATLVHRFIETSSFSGLLAIYTAQLALQTRMPFVMKDVWPPSVMEANYGHGYLVAAACMEIVAFTRKDDIINITAVSDQIPSLRERLVEWIKFQSEAAPDVWNVDAEVGRTIEAVERYFKS